MTSQNRKSKKEKKTKYEIKTKLFMYCLFYHSQYVYNLVVGFLQQQKLPLLPYKRDSKCVNTTPPPPKLGIIYEVKVFEK